MFVNATVEFTTNAFVVSEAITLLNVISFPVALYALKITELKLPVGIAKL